MGEILEIVWHLLLVEPKPFWERVLQLTAAPFYSCAEETRGGSHKHPYDVG